ncbi:MAG: hypothetical protein Q4F66_05480 [Clostridium sp.]|nr:hypothetical protein [Clostridium sp.]
MENKIIKSAVLFPHAYPWAKEELNKDMNQLNSVLKKYSLLEKRERRASIWNVNYSILRNCIGEDISIDNIISNVLSENSDKKYLNSELLSYIMKSLDLHKDENIKKYNKFISGNAVKDEILQSINLHLNWLVEIVLFSFASESNMEIRDLENQVECILNNKYDINENFSQKIQRIVRNKRLLGDSMEIFNETMSALNKDSKRLFDKAYNTNKTEVEASTSKTHGNNDSDFGNGFDLDGIVDLWSNSTALDMTEEEIKEQNDAEADKEINSKVKTLIKAEEEFYKEIESVDMAIEELNAQAEELQAQAEEQRSRIHKENCSNNNDINMNEVIDNLKNLNKSLGINTADENEVIVEKRKYEQIKNNEYKILKELVSEENDYVLSQLYNAYKNINNVSRENLEAILFNFFNTLSDNGFEAIDNGTNVGDTVEADIDRVLKDYVFDRAVEAGEGTISSTALYNGWSYKGKQIIPMVLKPMRK